MLKNAAKFLVAFALLSVLGSRAEAAPLWSAGAAQPNMKTVRLAYSPLPPRLRQEAFVLPVFNTQQAGGGGCWSHCYNVYDECLGISQKTICLTQIKSCMETCDRLTGLTNPTQRASQPDR